jgi:hypothetical protein
MKVYCRQKKEVGEMAKKLVRKGIKKGKVERA